MNEAVSAAPVRQHFEEPLELADACPVSAADDGATEHADQYPESDSAEATRTLGAVASAGAELEVPVADEPVLPSRIARRNRVEELLPRAIADDPVAIAEVMATVQAAVVSYCRNRLGRDGHQGIADDVAQEICIAVVNALPGYQLRGLSFMSFVYGIASHKVIDAYRTIGRSRTEPVPNVPDAPDTDRGPEKHVLDAELSEHTRELLDTLSPHQREILVLRVMDGLTAEETARIVGSTAVAVRVAQHRALKRLREQLGRQPARDLLNTL